MGRTPVSHRALSLSVEEAERLLRARQLDAARRAFCEAEAAGADADRCAGGRWMAAMFAGDFAAAWRENDAHRARQAPDVHRLWDGQSLDRKRVIVRCLHGFGDAVQMMRYAPALGALAREVVWEVAPRFVELARCMKGVGPVVTWGDDAPAIAPEWESQVELMELPYIFRSTLETLPATVPYCQAPLEEIDRVRGVMGPQHKPRVGLVWASGEWNAQRSIPLPLLRSLLTAEAICFWSLQGDDAGRQVAGMRDACSTCGNGLLALAATVANLDLVVTVDTLAAHLAGAMGKPAWVMLQKEADWRWLADGEKSPWYPTMRLFRQERQGAWDEVVATVCTELAGWRP